MLTQLLPPQRFAAHGRCLAPLFVGLSITFDLYTARFKTPGGSLLFQKSFALLNFGRMFGAFLSVKPKWL